MKIYIVVYETGDWDSVEKHIHSAWEDASSARICASRTERSEVVEVELHLAAKPTPFPDARA